MTLEKYEKTLDLWADEEREKAAKAKKDGDERQHSIHLMQASMLSDMLKVLGKCEMTRGPKGLLERQIASLAKESEHLRAMDDYDAAERSEIKAETIRRALSLIKNGDD